MSTELFENFHFMKLSFISFNFINQYFNEAKIIIDKIDRDQILKTYTLSQKENSGFDYELQC